MQSTRRYIRHPACVPLTYTVEANPEAEPAHQAFALQDVSAGGLCFTSAEAVEPGSPINIEIPIDSPPFRAKGIVAWCRPRGAKGDSYNVGVRFDDQITRYGVRMVEQVCHIERYRHRIKEREGRDLTGEEAAREWVERYAKQFPESGSGR